MIIPGSNLLGMAFGVIGQQEVQWERFIGNVENPLGQLVPTYADPEAIGGSIQSMDARDVQRLGLDMRSTYMTLYTMEPVEGIAKEGRQPDKISYAGNAYDVVGETDWMAQDGWKALVLQKK